MTGLLDVRQAHLKAKRMIDNASELDPAWLVGKKRIGVTAGASAPELLVNELIEVLKAHGVKTVRCLEGVEEHVHFPLPRGLGGKSADQS